MNTTTVSNTLPVIERNTTVKWHPGHYIKVPRNQYGKLLQGEGKYAQHLKNPNVEGFEVLFYWRQLEKGKGQYDFSEVRKVLDVLKQHGKHLIVSVQDRSFWSGANENPLPDYIYSMGGASKLAGVEHRPDRPGVAATTWKPQIMDRYISVFQALGQEFNRDPNFLGAQTTETALRTQEKPDKAALREQYERLALEGQKAMPNSMFIVGMNFLDDGRGRTTALSDIAKAVEKAGGALTTPDVVPSKGEDFSAYPVLHAFKDKVPVVAGGDDSRRSGSDTPDRVQQFAKNYLGADYIVWKDNLPANPIDLNGAPPSGYKVRTTSTSSGNGDPSTTSSGNGDPSTIPSGNGDPSTDPGKPSQEPDDDFIISPPDSNGGATGGSNDGTVSAKFIITPIDNSLAGKPQGKAQAPLIDLRSVDLNQDSKADDKISVTFSNVRSNANSNHSVGLYRIADESGAVLDPVTAQLIRPSEAGYAAAALEQRVPEAELQQNTKTLTTQLNGGALLAPYLITTGTAEQFLSENPNNQQGQDLHAFFAYRGANPDKAKHVKLLDNNQFSFEDTWGKGDKKFDDFSFKLNATTA
jgi:Domain of unknown function (DUF4114)